MALRIPTRPEFALAPVGARACVAALATAALLALLLPSAASGAFVARPSPGAGGATYNPAAELTWTNGTLYASWTDVSGGDAYASWWNGAGWTALPVIGTAAGGRTDPSLAHDGTQLWAAFNDGVDEPRVKFYNGAVWTLITDPTVPNTGVWSFPNLAWDGSLLWLAWQDTGRVVRVSTWNGATWTPLASPGGGAGSNAYPNLEYNETTGRMWITWNSAGTAQVSEYVAGAWNSRGSVGDGAGNKVPGITNVGQTMLVSWDDDPNHEVRTHSYVGGAWHEVDSHRPGASPYFSYPDLAWTGSTLWASNSDTNASVAVEAWEWDQAPLRPVDRRQLRADGSTAIPAAGTTIDGASTNVVLRGRALSATAGQLVTPWVEVRPFGSPFTATCGQTIAGVTFSGPSVNLVTAGQDYQVDVNVTGLTPGTDYHWRMCVRTATLPSSWGEASTTQRFTVVTPPAPTALFTDDSNASAGTTNNASIIQDDFRLSWRSNAGDAVDRQRVQVVNSTFTGPGIVGSWRLDGTPADATGGSGALVFSAPPNDPAYGAAKPGFGQSLEGDTDDRAVTAAHDPAYDLDTFTIEAWLQLDGLTEAPGNENIISAKQASSTDRNWRFSVMNVDGSVGQLWGSISASGVAITPVQGTTNLNDGQWHHVAMVVDSTPVDPNKEIRLYVDGVLEDVQRFSGNVDNTPDNIAFLGRESGGRHLWGRLDDIRISSVARTQSDFNSIVGHDLPHESVLWDSDTSNAGVALSAACSTATRCSDVTYGATGVPAQLRYDDARYFARAKLRTSAGNIWSSWSGYDWFRTQDSTSISTAGCTGAALDFGSLVAGSAYVTQQDCTVGWGSSGSTTQLRLYQTDQDGVAAFTASNGTADAGWAGDGSLEFNSSGNDWAGRMAYDPERDRLLVAADGDQLRIHAFDQSGAAHPGWNQGASLRLLDGTFGSGSDDPYSIEVDPLGRVVVVGRDTDGDRRAFFVRLTRNGTLDPSTASGTGYEYFDLSAANDDQFHEVEPLPDGGYLVAGTINQAGASWDVVIGRLDDRGAPDPTWPASGTGGAPAGFAYYSFGTDDRVWDAELQPDGRLVVVGSADNDVLVARFTADGALDTAGFSTGDGSNGYDVRNLGGTDNGRAVELDPAGRVVVAARAASTATTLLRYTAAGALDPSFNGTGSATVVTGGTNSWIGLVVQGGTGITVATDSGGGLDAVLARVRPNGVLDPGFGAAGLVTYTHAGATSELFNDAVAGPDGRIYASGRADIAGLGEVLVNRYAGAELIADYALGISDMDDGPSTFGACLRSVSSATADWSVSATCPTTDGAHWNPIAASRMAAGALVAHTTVAEPAATASIRFGVRTPALAAGQTVYQAPITIEVVDPAL